MVIEKFVEYHGRGGGRSRGEFTPWYGSSYYDDGVTFSYNPIPTTTPASVREPYEFIEHFTSTPHMNKNDNKFPVELIALLILILIIVIVFITYSLKK